MACCQHDYRVRFVTAAELVTLLVEAQQQGRLQRKLDQLARFDVVILDELGYVPFDKAGADLLFGFISQRYERRSLVVTTNLPFARWSEVFLDATAAAAVIDRIVHHATVLTTAGDSYRLKVATRNHASRATQEVPRRDDHHNSKMGVPFQVAKRSLFCLPFPTRTHATRSDPGKVPASTASQRRRCSLPSNARRRPSRPMHFGAQSRGLRTPCERFAP